MYACAPSSEVITNGALSPHALGIREKLDVRDDKSSPRSAQERSDLKPEIHRVDP
jgi:hypothetical protein